MTIILMKGYFIPIIVVVVFIIISIVITLLSLRNPEIKCGLSKEGHEWDSRDENNSQSSCRCIARTFKIIYCRKCGKIKNTDKMY